MSVDDAGEGAVDTGAGVGAVSTGARGGAVDAGAEDGGIDALPPAARSSMIRLSFRAWRDFMPKSDMSSSIGIPRRS